MKFTRLFLPALLIAGVNLSSRAADEATTEVQTITYTVSCDEGTLTGSGTYRSTWTSSEVEAGINVVAHAQATGGATANNFNNTSTGWLKLNSGSSGGTKVEIEALKGGKWYVSHYAFKAVLTTSQSGMTISSQGKADQALASGTEVAIEETLTKDQSAYFVVKGANGNPVELKDFTVTITLDPEYVEPDYEFPVEADLIVDGEFDEWTTWYNLKLAVNGYALFNNGEEKMTFTGEDTAHYLDEGHLWAFVVEDEEEHTVKIYNRATGTDKVLAAPKGGTGYPRMMAEGDPSYCYTWKVNKAEYKSDGTAIPASFDNRRPVYISLSDNDNAILNNFGGKGQLDFWTGGYDQNSVIVPVVIESKVAINMANGFMRRANGADEPANRWQGRWFYGGNMNIRFGMGSNNLTISEWDPANVDEHPEAYLQLASSLGGNTFTFTLPDYYYISDIAATVYTPSEDGETHLRISCAVEGVEVEDIELDLRGTERHEIMMRDLPNDYIPQFTTTGVNDLDNNVVLENFRIRVRRHVREFQPATIVFEKGNSHQIRIPAITTVGKGEHEGRLITAYDYRWCGGDLGGGNIDLTIAMSDDNGATWTAPGHALDAEGNAVTEYNHNWTKTNTNWSEIQGKATEAWDAAWGDAALVGDRESQTVMMIAVGGPTGFWDSRRNNPQSAIRWISHDGGDTWSAPQNITEKIYSLFDGEPRNGKIDGMFFGSGRAMQSRYIKVGDYYRVYSVISSQNNGGSTRNWVLYTDDMGENWNILGSYDQCPVASNADEPKAEELPDGSVLVAARGQGGNRNFNIFRYTNPTTGEGKWIGTHINTNMGMGSINACDGEIYIVPAKKVATEEPCFLALQSFPYGGSRKMVSVAWKSLDSGEDFVTASNFTKWGGRYQVCADGHEAAYSTMSLMPNGHMAFFYEEQLTGIYDGVFKELSLELITDGEYEFYPDQDNAIAVALTQSLVEKRMNDYSGDNMDEVMGAGEEYMENPTYANYIKFNRAEYGFDGEADDYDFPYEEVALWPGTKVTVLEIKPESAEVEVGKTITLELNIDKEAEWTSSNELVASVSNGVVSGLSVGEAVITAKIGSKTATCLVSVVPEEEVGIVEISAGGADRIYDLQGRRVVKPHQGLYIVNGTLKAKAK